MNLIQRIKQPTPKYFRVLRNIGAILAVAGGAVLSSPVVLPAALITVAGYLVVAGSVISAISQTAVEHEPDEEGEKKENASTFMD